LFRKFLEAKIPAMARIQFKAGIAAVRNGKVARNSLLSSPYLIHDQTSINRLDDLATERVDR
jgi:hypothetical protein